MPEIGVKATESYCPFGCKVPDCWNGERGYCVHLVGFTNDGKTYEPITVDHRGFPKVDAGRRKKLCQKVDLKKHVIVNPEYDQLDNGVVHKAKLWVSSRVYSKTPEHTTELKELMTSIAEGGVSEHDG